MYFADEAIVVTNPEVSSVRDSDRMLGLLSSQTKRAETQGAEPIKAQVLITRYDQERVDRGEMMTVDDVLEILAVPLLGVVPESKAILKASNVGTPVTLDGPSAASQAYNDARQCLTGTQVGDAHQGERRPGLFSVCSGGRHEPVPDSPARRPRPRPRRRPRTACRSFWPMNAAAAAPPRRITCRCCSAISSRRSARTCRSATRMSTSAWSAATTCQP